MIVNIYEAKTEALLFMCREIILFYRDKDTNSFNISANIKKYIYQEIETILKGINAIIQPKQYYIQNQKFVRMRYIIQYVNFLEQQLSIMLKKNEVFNPSILVVSLLTTWFKEFEIVDNKVYVFFKIYPYWEFFDKIFIEIKDKRFKQISYKMLDISERLLLKYKNK